jgi:phytoene dehydrogenase-like protein
VTGAPDAVVVGSGPNGLTAAVVLARAGLSVTVYEAHDEIGGGTRTAELTVPGLRHDVCSASHPFGVASPYLSTLPLAEHGLTWAWADIELAHPLDGGRVAALHRSLELTADGLGPGGPGWRRLFGPLRAGFDDLVGEILQPLLHVPRHPVRLARFGLRAAPSATALGRLLGSDEARALFAGSAAHIMRPLSRPFTASVGVMLTAVGHQVGWPVAVGGSHAITHALASLLRAHGGTIETGAAITAANLPPASIQMFDTSPAGLAAVVGDRLSGRTRRALSRWRHGPAAFKLDLAVEGGIPWTAPPARRAGVVHVGGTMEEIAATESEVHQGRMPERPFVLVGQQYLADPSRSAGDVHPIWTYAHVPHGYAIDATEAILGQLERFAPGTRERIVGSATLDPPSLERYNVNYVGGDIATGANDLRQLVFRPRPSISPYRAGTSGVYLCSAATPPGAGVHGMCGYHAATRALADLRR